MAPGFPLVVNDVRILTSEALYQACRFPHRPEVQELIFAQNSPMTAKMKSRPYREDSRPDWENIRVAVMRWCLRVKISQNWDRFATLLRETHDRPIVEESNKDPFWGARPVNAEQLEGANVLGRLLMELRSFITGPDADQYRAVETPKIKQFLIFNEPIRAIGTPTIKTVTSIPDKDVSQDLLFSSRDLDATPIAADAQSEKITVDSNDSLAAALQSISAFIGPKLSSKISALEQSIKGCSGDDCRIRGIGLGTTSSLLTAAHSVKQAAGQIHIVIHAVGAMLLIPQIMEPDEIIESVSLGAGNTDREFDFETDRRIVEFKFIHWRGGAEVIRQNALFKDFYCLAERQTKKRKELYVLRTEHPLKFLRSGRSLASVMSRNRKLWDEFKVMHGEKFATVGQYYAARQHEVALIDAVPFVPELAQITAIDSEDEI